MSALEKKQAFGQGGFRLPELLAPAGNPERLRVALHYGADAAYVGLKAMSLRNFADNFSQEELAEGCALAHSLGKRIYVTVNAFARDEDLEVLPGLLSQAAEAGADALIVNDPGVVRLTRRLLPDMPLHLSTQANTLNAQAAAFWQEQGIGRIVLARELSIAQMRHLREQGPVGMEYEAFVHGAMCVSYSGRCLLSAYIAGRDPNRGECAQPCRWSYELRERGPAEGAYPIEQDALGTYVLNSKDLCLIDHIPALVEAGLHCLKIEGRMKSIAYVATVVNAYRMALDDYARSRALDMEYILPPILSGELGRASHRPYTTGFALGGAAANIQATASADYVTDAAIGAVVLAYDASKHMAHIEQRNKFLDGDVLSILSPGDLGRSFSVSGIWNEDYEPVKSTPHPRERLMIGCAEPLLPGDILRIIPEKKT